MQLDWFDEGYCAFVAISASPTQNTYTGEPLWPRKGGCKGLQSEMRMAGAVPVSDSVFSGSESLKGPAVMWRHAIRELEELVCRCLPSCTLAVCFASSISCSVAPAHCPPFLISRGASQHKAGRPCFHPCSYGSEGHAQVDTRMSHADMNNAHECALCAGMKHVRM